MVTLTLLLFCMLDEVASISFYSLCMNIAHYTSLVLYLGCNAQNMHLFKYLPGVLFKFNFI